ncbi:MAG: glutamine synthetase, partial [Proteobacteria bacterium]|nr:glutamine synthetase [Pseudomonadota bacterium]
ADTHGHARAKLVTVPAFLAALVDGYNINVATTTLDASGARTFSSFTRGGGMGLAEMTGSPNITIVPEPSSFRALPWAPGVGWIMCEEYFNDGRPYHFSPRQLLRRQLARLHERGMDIKVGLEVEWYLLRVLGEGLGDDNIGAPGMRGRPIATAPVEPGYAYHSESNMDLMQPVLSALAEHCERIDLPLRSIENEWGPGQVECTFAPSAAIAAADNLVLFRSATRQICRRMGHFATFMCRPGIKGFYSSGWHLHQSLVNSADGRNLFMPETAGQPCSPLARHFLGGLIEHAAAATVFTTPTINGYRRFRPNSLAPDRITWAFDHRGVMIRVLGGAGDAASRFENRCGEPSANPYLYMLAQIIAGLDGVDHERDPGPACDEPYASGHPLLPKSLPAALDALDRSTLFRREIGAIYVDYFQRLKRNEIGRFERWQEDTGNSGDGEDVTEWEQNEYFDFF